MNIINTMIVCICTYNRAILLRFVLDKLEKINAPDGCHFDVIVVDNMSTDNTHEVVSEYIQRNPNRFRYIYEEKIGLSKARNRGLQESTSDIIAFLDDDAVPRDGWLEALIESYAQGADIGVVGGQVLLALPDGPFPRWFQKPLYPLFSEREVRDEKIRECHKIADYPFGANISFRRELAIDFGGFNPALGRIGKKMLSGEETQLCEQIRKAGYRILIHPKMIVDHYIPLDRISLRYLFRQAWGDGQSCYAWSNVEFSALNSKRVILNFFQYALGYAIDLVIHTRTLPGVIWRSYNLVTNMSMLYYRWKICRSR